MDTDPQRKKNWIRIRIEKKKLDPDTQIMNEVPQPGRFHSLAGITIFGSGEQLVLYKVHPSGVNNAGHNNVNTGW